MATCWVIQRASFWNSYLSNVAFGIPNGGSVVEETPNEIPAIVKPMCSRSPVVMVMMGHRAARNCRQIAKMQRGVLVTLEERYGSERLLTLTKQGMC